MHTEDWVGVKGASGVKGAGIRLRENKTPPVLDQESSNDGQFILIGVSVAYGYTCFEIIGVYTEPQLRSSYAKQRAQQPSCIRGKVLLKLVIMWRM